jgi:hypothetical protein
MGSRVPWAVNVGFGTTLLVTTMSYYFCVRTRQHKEQVIEYMMKAQMVEEAQHMPPEPPLEHHPFLAPATTTTDSTATATDSAATVTGLREYRGMLPEKKEWQQPLETQDAKDVLKEVKRR